MEAEVLKRLFSVDEFHQMAEAGVFAEDDRLELLDGEIVRMTPIGSRHSGCVARVSELLWERCRASAIVNVQNPLVLSEGTECYPDIALLQRRGDFYTTSHPGPGDVLLVIEVADTTGDYDRRVKVPRYARAGIPEVWVIDLREGAVDVYVGASKGEFRVQRKLRAGESLTIPGARDPQLAVDDILTPLNA